jgi:hypothetical protein
MTGLFKLSAILMVAAFLFPITGKTVFAQQAITGKPPVMENVFFNVVWGAGMGALIGVSSAALASGKASQPKDLRGNVITGATLGSVVGLGVGVWLLFNGVTFDPSRSLLFGSGVADADGVPMFSPPLVLESKPGEPFRITGFKALVFHKEF